MASKVSVIITTHNRPHMLPRAVASAQRAGTDVEVIVVDDASTDDTASVCRQLPDIHYLRLKYNQNVAGARNASILASSSPYITFLDDDDLRLPGSVDRQLEILESYPLAGMVYGQMVVGDQNCQPTEQVLPAQCPGGDLFWPLLRGNFIPCLSVVFRRQSLMRVGLLNCQLPGIDDWDLWVRIAERYPIVAHREPVAIWRQSTPFSAQGSSQTAHIYSLMARQQLQLLQLPRALAAKHSQRVQTRRCLLNMIFNALVHQSAASLATGHLSGIHINMAAALKIYPTRGVHLLTWARFVYVLWQYLRTGKHCLSLSTLLQVKDK